jgi:hypothetical protein
MNKNAEISETEIFVNLGFTDKPKKADFDAEAFPSKLGGKPVK